MMLDFLMRIVFWVVSIVSSYFSIRMVVMFIYRSYEKKLERKKSITTLSIPPNLFFSILLPARNEASVIQKTLSKMCEIKFPPEQFEIYVITDAKEKSIDSSPTTYEEVHQFIQDNSSKTTPYIHLITVPEGFDGNLFGSIQSTPVNSTKGRALNYCISQIKSRGMFHILSFFDAESHPNPLIFQKLATHYASEETPSVYQGPLFQVRNFWKVSFFTKIASLTQAFSHEYSLPMILKWIPLLRGTNMHMPIEIMKGIGGFSHTTMTEDLELGVRLHLLKNIKPKFIDVPSSEQTPATIKGYFHQRSRWGGGNVDTLNQIYQLIQDTKEKNFKAKLEKLFVKLCFYGPGEWIAYFCIGIVIVLTYLNLLWRALTVFINFFTWSIHFYYYIFLSGIRILITPPMLISGFFILVLYFRYSYLIADAWNPEHLIQLLLVYSFAVIVLPFIGWIYTYPFVYACFTYWMGYSQQVWVKTERSIEI